MDLWFERDETVKRYRYTHLQATLHYVGANILDTNAAFPSPPSEVRTLMGYGFVLVCINISFTIYSPDSEGEVTNTAVTSTQIQRLIKLDHDMSLVPLPALSNIFNDIFPTPLA